MAYLQAEGFQVKSMFMDAEHLPDLKVSLNIPPEMWSCHTSIVNGFFVEGHVPVEAIRTLLDQQPAIEGIALPGMPSGSPGMGGLKAKPLIIYSVAKGKLAEFLRY